MHVNYLAFFSFNDVCQVFITERYSISRDQSKSNSELVIPFWIVVYCILVVCESMIIPPTSVEAEHFFQLVDYLILNKIMQ